MRGHWVTSGLRKLNKHYQSSGNMAEKTWDGSIYGTTYFNRLTNIGSEYAFAMMYILKRLRKEERTITG